MVGQCVGYEGDLGIVDSLRGGGGSVREGVSVRGWVGVSVRGWVGVSVRGWVGVSVRGGVSMRGY